ncbi:MAG: tricarballylate utilization 4Fe-4S protein TcuB [Alphaproteobacteria bacterium]|nr:tricarballylate utilization 4Fe-4S protein TcuB [Alphaproteobacteria bacterium]
MSLDLQRLARASHDETQRLMQICNACRYCEGFCAVFPAMERRRIFDEGDTAFLANLCHNCGACYHACQYAPPHEFGVNVPAVLAERRLDTYTDYAWPAPMGRLFSHNGMVVSAVISLALALVVGVMLAMIAPRLFWGVHLGEGAFYQIMPHTVMAGIPLVISAFVLVSFVMGWRRYWRSTGARWGGMPAMRDALAAMASLRYHGGDNAGGSPGCPSTGSRSSNARKYYHHLTFYGFMMCFASTSLGTLYHYVLGREAPYGYFELPVVLGTVGGVILCLGTAGLWHEKRRMDKAVRSALTLGMDYAFIGLLFWVSATGLILLAVRETSFMGLALAIHLGIVYGFFLILPFSKFVHGIYRFAALLADAREQRQGVAAKTT